jgi:hypothetical protein
MPSSESGALKRRLGKWSTPGVPHKGWTCIDTDDLGANGKQICQMCETSQIRWAHTMTHSDYKGQLVVGVVCAGHMEENLLKEWPQGWQVLLRPLPDGELIPGKKRFPTVEAAKLAAYASPQSG